MKVAICFYGQPRFYKQVLPIWDKVISELEADVFIHTWYGVERTKEYVDVNELIADFNPKEIQISNPHRFVDIIPKNSTYENQSFHAMQQAYSLQTSVCILEQYEIDLNQKYDIIIRCRMDIQLLDADRFIEFMKNMNPHEGNFYVCGKCWKGSSRFDDNIIVGNGGMIKDISLMYFNYTISCIHKTKIIPGGESNLFNYFNYRNMYDRVHKEDAVNFDLLYMTPGNFIMNQNE